MMVKVLLPKAEINSNDAADALAIAICHAQHRKILENRGNIKELETSMIGKLTGIVDTIGEDFVIVDVNGVGYLVNCSARILDQLPAKGESTTFWIETYVREDQIRLFGFSTFIEREWFRMLMTVQGVGAKVALAILGVVDASELANALALGDIASITRAPGVGKACCGTNNH